MKQLTIKVEKGHGYYDLTSHPWGGSFNRFDKDYVLQITKVLTTYLDGSPQKVTAIHPSTNKKKIGIEI